MKNFYANFKCVLCTLVGAALIATSCHEPYDDTELRNEIADLFAKVEALEQRLDAEVDALTTLIAAAESNLTEAINSKTVVTSATEKEDGSWEIILSTGQKITVHPKFVPTPQEPEKNEGCITVIKEGDAYYWAVITNGTPVAMTDASGNKIPVGHNTQPMIDVNPTTGEVRISVDGGATWVTVEKQAEQNGGVQETSCIFTGVKDSEHSVEFMLADGSIISIPKAEEIDFGVKAGKTFVVPGESVDVALTANNIDDLTVIAKPEGWKATINGKIITVTAPKQEAIDNGSAELEGVIKIHASGNDGKCKVGKLPVSASDKSVILAIDGDKLTIYNNAGLRRSGVNYGISRSADFSAEAIAEAKNEYSLMAMEAYDPVTEVSIKMLYNYLVLENYDDANLVELPAGESYVIWAIAGSDDWAHVYSAEEVIYTLFTPPFLNIEKGKVTFNTAEISVVGGGYDSYIVGSLNGINVEEAKASLKNSFENWQYGYGEFGDTVTDLYFKGNVTDFHYMGWPNEIYPNTTYLVYVLPMTEGKSGGDYKFEDIVLCDITTSNIEAGGSATLEITASETTYTYIDINITGSSNTAIIYAAPLSEDEMKQYSTDEALLEYVIAYCTEYSQIQMGNTGSAYISSLTPGESAYVAAIAVDENGKYSKLYKEKFSAKSLAFNESLKVKIDEQASTVGISTAKIKVSTEGGTAVKYRYLVTETGGYYWNSMGSVAAAEGTIAISTSYYIQEIGVDELVDGCIAVSDLETGSEHIFVVLAFDAEGNPSRATSMLFTPSLPEYPLIRSTNEAYAAAKPTYSFNVVWNGDIGCFDIACDITPAAGTQKYWVAGLGQEYLSSDSAARDAVNYLLLKEGQYYGSEAFTSAATYNGTYIFDVNSNLWITWMDAQGNYYECIREPIFKWNYVEKTAAEWTASEPTVTASLSGNTLSYTVTPGAGATKVWIFAHPYRLYYEDNTLTYMMTLNPECIASETAYSGTLDMATAESHIYVAWTDAAGNLYQAKDVALQ